MATNIGPRIGVDGEKEYRDAMASIIQQQKTLKAEMKETASAFDAEASSQDKAKAKMEGLTKQIDLQREKVDRLREMTEKSTQATGEDSDATLKYKEALAKAQTELNNMESEQKELSDEIKKAPYEDMKKKLGEVQQKLKDVGDGLKDFGDKMTKYVTGPLAAVAGLSVKAFKDVDDASDTLRKMTGATGDAFEDLWDRTKAIATTLPVTLDDASAAMGEVATRFDATGDEASALTELFLKFASVTDADVVSSIDGVQKTMAAWGLTTDKTSALLDAFTYVAQMTGADVNTLSTAVASNKTLFDDMGMSVFTAAEYVGELDKNGLDANTVLAGLKKALANATKEGVPLDKALSDLSDTLINADSDTEAYTAAMELFGNKAGPQLADALRDGRISITDFKRVAVESMGAVENTFNDTLDPIDRYQSLLNELKIMGAEVGGTLLESLAPAIEKIAEAVQKAAEWWAGLSDEQKKTILVVAGVVAAIGPVLSFLGTLVTIISGMIPIMGALGVSIGGVMAAAAPVVAVILSIIAVVMIVVEVVKHWGEITEWLGETWHKITDWIVGDATSVSDWVDKKWTAICDWTEQAWSDVKDWTKQAWEDTKEAVKDAAEAVSSWVSEKWANIKDTVSTTWENLKSNTKQAWENIKNKVQENGGGIRGVLAGAVEGYKSIWRTGFSAINDLTGGKLGEVLQKVRDKLQAVKDKFTSVFDSIKDFVKNTLDKIKNFFSNLTLSLPHIKLPHFKLTGSFSLSPPSVPKLSVDWYKKAYDSAMVFSQPTVLATAAGLKGFGDGNGAEIVVGQKTLLDTIETAMRRVGGGGTYDIDITIYGSDGQDVDDIATAVAERLSFEISRREAALA